MSEIELHRGTPFLSSAELNRLARQQELSVVLAKARIFDQICQEVALPEDREAELIKTFLQQEELGNDNELEDYLALRGWQEADLIYVATKAEKLQRFQQQVFGQEVEINYLGRKIDFDKVSYHLICLQDADEAFEWHQRLLEGEANLDQFKYITTEEDFGKLNSGRYGPQSISQAHPSLVSRLRVGDPGQVWPPFISETYWVVLQLDQRAGTPLDERVYAELLDELFDAWLHKRIIQLLTGNKLSDLPVNLLSTPNKSSKTKHQEEIPAAAKAAFKPRNKSSRSEGIPNPTTPKTRQSLSFSVQELIGLGNCNHPEALAWAKKKGREKCTDYENLLLSIFYRLSGRQPEAQQQVLNLTKQNLFDAYVNMITSQCFELSLNEALKTSFEALSQEIKKTIIWSHSQRSYFQDICKTLQHSSHLSHPKNTQGVKQCHYKETDQARLISSPGLIHECPLTTTTHSATFLADLGLWIDNKNHRPIADLLHPSNDFRSFIGNSSPHLYPGKLPHHEKKVFSIKGPVIYIDFNPHFGHFITHSCSFATPLLAAESVTKESSNSSLTILSASVLPRWAKKILRLATTLELKFASIPNECSAVEVDLLVTAPPSWIEWHYCSSNHRKLFQAIANNASKASKNISTSSILAPLKEHKKIYFSRSKISDGLRTSVNENELEQHLMDRGFKIIHPQELELTDLIHLISQSSLIAGPAGTAMHNILFAKNQTGLTTLNFDHQLAHNQILIENACNVKQNFHSFSTKQVNRDGKAYLYFDIEKCLNSTDQVIDHIDALQK